MHWVYTAWDSDGVCLYVGRTSTSRPWRRMFEHAKRSAWYQEASLIEFHGFEKHADMRNAEDELWFTCKPSHNARRPGRVNDNPVPWTAKRLFERDSCGRFHPVTGSSK